MHSRGSPGPCRRAHRIAIASCRRDIGRLPHFPAVRRKSRKRQLPGTAGGEGRYIGMQPDISAQWTMSPNLFLTVEAAYFDVSERLKQSGGRDVFYSLVDLSFMF